MTKITISDSLKALPVTIGTWYLADGDLFLLVQTEAGVVNLISAQSGNRFSISLDVGSIRNLTEGHLSKLFGQGVVFRPVNVEITVLP